VANQRQLIVIAGRQAWRPVAAVELPWAHQGASHGLFDRLLTARPRIGGSNSRSLPRQAITQAPAKFPQ